MNVFACWRPGLVCGAAGLKMSPKTRSRCLKPLRQTYRLGKGLVGSREGFAQDKAAACLPVLRRAQCFRRASEPSQASEQSPQGRLGPLLGRFRFKTRFAGRPETGPHSGPRATQITLRVPLAVLDTAKKPLQRARTTPGSSGQVQRCAEESQTPRRRRSDGRTVDPPHHRQGRDENIFTCEPGRRRRDEPPS